MRLLNIHTFEFEDFQPPEVPSYAIASHRWSRGQEASIQDVLGKRNIDKPGYKKVTGFAQYIQSNVSGIDWLWIDTCCIDHRSSQEVSEAINSMFRWYSLASVCLAYLADVETLDVEDFIQTKWFTRGWTLQELLAPKTVIFLSSDWRIIGHKADNASVDSLVSFDIGRPLERAISSVTKIPVQILKDYEQSRGLTVDEKLAWTLGRRTTREEDMSYCLFGIFDVAIGANYGEGGEKARRRLLREVFESNRGSDNALSAVAGASRSLPGSSRSHSTEERVAHELLQKTMMSFSFPQMEDRRDHIHTAYQGTYRWALLSTADTNSKWDNLVAWLSDSQPMSRVYWVNAKPGAGKSSLIRFLDDELIAERHMQPWAENMPVLQAHYYFWSPGNHLQKSLAGLLRTILQQLFEHCPELLSSCLPFRKRIEIESARNAGDIYWTIPELQQCLRKFISASSSSAKSLILIDGLDEIDGDEDNQEELVEFLRGLAALPSVKICVSSRRWTIFEDAFARCPQLRLEDLNARDIATYVQGQLMAQRLYQQMLTYDPSAGRLISDVILKAQGVFLWTRLVVKELTRGIRDGDSYHTLHAKLDSMPGDLNSYFSRLIDSIEPYHRREACIMLQIALYEELDFTTLHPLRLLDLIFIQDADHDFALSDTKNLYIENFGRAEELFYRLDSTIRRLSGLSKGLLECYFDNGSTLTDFAIDAEVDGEQSAAGELGSYALDAAGISHRTVTSLPGELLPVLRQEKYVAMDFKIDFMHRSLRDYLLEPNSIQFLNQHTGGSFDTRNYLRNARLVQIYMSTSAKLEDQLSLGLASYFISTLSVPSFRNDPRCAQYLTTFQPLVAAFANTDAADAGSFWYISHSVRSWPREEGDFYTLAIDFGFTGYLAQTITSDMVRQKHVRPLLDYALRTRFADFFAYGDVSVGLQYPHPNLVHLLLFRGANPNERVDGIPLWPLFLSFLAEQDALYATSEPPPSNVDLARKGYFFSLEAMIKNGADVVLERPDLSAHFMHGMFARRSSTKDQSNNFARRWPGLTRKANMGVEAFALSDVLECLRPIFGHQIDRLKALSLRESDAEQGAHMPLALEDVE